LENLFGAPFADKIGRLFTFLIGIFLTALFVIAFGLSPNVMAFTGFSFLLYCTKSSGWPGMTKLVGNGIIRNIMGELGVFYLPVRYLVLCWLLYSSVGF
jgi:sugar phosphate permease